MLEASATAVTSDARSPDNGPRPLGFAGCLGWLHPAHGPAMRPAGVLIVNGLGRDGRCAHRPLRLLAEQLAQAGFPTVRYDHPGQGDSLDIVGQDALSAWTQAVCAAAETLKAAAGVQQIALIGLRFGAALAALADIEPRAVVALAPVLDGRRWLRELKLAARLAGTLNEVPGQVFEAEGLALDWPTVDAIAALRLAYAGQGTPWVFAALPDAGSSSLASAFDDLGLDAQIEDFPDHDGLFEDAHSNQAPQLTFDRVTAWLCEAFPTPIPALPVPDFVAAPLRTEAASETTIRFGEGLIGVYCAPAAAPADRRAAVFCNTGGDPRSGVGGFAALAARRLAAEGFASLRFDFAGLGDSPPPPGADRSHVFETPRERDFEAAADALRRRGHDDLIVVGVCSGAYHALNAVSGNAAFSGAFAVSPVHIAWTAEDSLTGGLNDQAKPTRSYVDAALQPDTWIRLARGQIDLKTIASALLQRAARRWPSGPEAGRARALNERIAKVSKRGGRVHLLMGLTDASVDEVETYFGPDGRRLARMPGMAVTIHRELDHGLALRRSREIACEALLRFIKA